MSHLEGTSGITTFANPTLGTQTSFSSERQRLWPKDAQQGIDVAGAREGDVVQLWS
jgi:hypothetical protein